MPPLENSERASIFSLGRKSRVDHGIRHRSRYVHPRPSAARIANSGGERAIGLNSAFRPLKLSVRKEAEGKSSSVSGGRRRKREREGGSRRESKDSTMQPWPNCRSHSITQQAPTTGDSQPHSASSSFHRLDCRAGANGVSYTSRKNRRVSEARTDCWTGTASASARQKRNEGGQVSGSSAGLGGRAEA